MLDNAIRSSFQAQARSQHNRTAFSAEPLILIVVPQLIFISNLFHEQQLLHTLSSSNHGACVVPEVSAPQGCPETSEQGHFQLLRERQYPLLRRGRSRSTRFVQWPRGFVQWSMRSRSKEDQHHVQEIWPRRFVKWPKGFVQWSRRFI